MVEIIPLFKALADEKRIRIVALISARQLSVEEMSLRAILEHIAGGLVDALAVDQR